MLDSVVVSDVERVIRLSAQIERVREERKALRKRSRALKAQESSLLKDLAAAMAEHPPTNLHLSVDDDVDDDDENGAEESGGEEDDDPDSLTRTAPRGSVSALALDTLRAHAGEEMTASEVAHAGGLAEERLDSLRTALHRLHKRGEIERRGTGRYMAPKEGDRGA
jgi:hypothetical protein